MLYKLWDLNNEAMVQTHQSDGDATTQLELVGVYGGVEHTLSRNKEVVLTFNSSLIFPNTNFLDQQHFKHYDLKFCSVMMSTTTFLFNNKLNINFKNVTNELLMRFNL